MIGLKIVVSHQVWYPWQMLIETIPVESRSYGELTGNIKQFGEATFSKVLA